MAVESTKLIEGFEFEITSGAHKVRTDVEVKLGGKGSAPDPHDYVQIALASCTAITVQMYAKRKGIPLEYSDVQVHITAEGASNEIQRDIKFVGNLTAEQKQQLLNIAEKCPIHKFLSAGAKISSRLVD